MTTKIPDQNEIDSWDLAKTLDYAREGLKFYQNDRTELINRRNVLLSSPARNTNTVLREVVMLSLDAGDFDSVKKFIGYLEDAGDPAMGYHVYNKMKEKRLEQKVIIYLESSAKHGHILAQHANIIRKLNKRSPLSKVLILPAIKLYFLLKITVIAFRNPKDIRLK